MKLVLVIAAILAGCCAAPPPQVGMDDLWGPDLDYSSLAK
jgi:hypothetical protein